MYTRPMASRADIEQAVAAAESRNPFLPSAERTLQIELMNKHRELSESGEALDGWNWIRERFVRKLHENLFKRDREYREATRLAIFNGYPFCPFERRAACWITVLFPYQTIPPEIYDHPMEGLCYSCFKNKVYHKAMTVWGTELTESDCFTTPMRVICENSDIKKFFKDEGRGRKTKTKNEISLLEKFKKRG